MRQGSEGDQENHYDRERRDPVKLWLKKGLGTRYGTERRDSKVWDRNERQQNIGGQGGGSARYWAGGRDSRIWDRS